MKRKIFSTLFALVLLLTLGLVTAAPASAATMTVEATPANIMAGATTNYDIVFTTVTADTIVTVDMVFDAEFDVSGATLVGATGLLAGTVSISGQVVTYTVTAPASAAGEANTITLSGIVNPAAGVYEVTVRTWDAFEEIIDQGIDEEVTIGPAPLSFLVVAATNNIVTAGTAFTVVVTAKAEAAGTGATVEGYHGEYLIDFTSTASEPNTIPAFEVIDFDEGVGTTSTSFVLNVVETGKTITATDSELGITGTSNLITFAVITLDRLTITGAPTSVTAGVAFSGDITVTAEDALGNVITDYANEVTWSGGGAGASWPAAYTFDTGDAGIHTFSGSEFILKKAGSQIITVTETVGGTDTRSASITVYPAAASKLYVTATPDTIAANGFASSTITAWAQDVFGNGVWHSAVITFQTSVGGFTEANGASTYSVASAPYTAPYYSPYDYTATATLTSTDTGVATVKVTSGSLTCATVPVELTVDAAPTVVWVDDDYSEFSDGGHVWDTDAFDTIQEGIDAVAEGGTVNVAPGTYKHAEEGLPIEVNVAGVTLQSTYGALLTKIDCEGNQDGIYITAEDVTVDGFWVKDAFQFALKVHGADATVKNNKITSTTNWISVHVAGTALGSTVSNNTLDSKSCMVVASLAGNRLVPSIGIVTLSDNTLAGGLNFQGVTKAVDITGNTIIGSGGAGIQFGAGSYDDILIQDNTISRTTLGAADEGGIAFRDPVGTVTNVTITGNTITDNEDAGIRIGDVTWGVGNTIYNNNISGNVAYGLDNLMTAETVVDAQNNWWGDATGPYHSSTNSAAAGDAVSDFVDYRPWLLAPYAEPAAPVTSYTITLTEGYNLVSLPLIPEDTDIVAMTTSLTECQKIRRYVPGATPPDDWPVYNYGLPGASTLLTMEDGYGYWVKMDAVGSFTFNGWELVAETDPPSVPPSYDVVTGWNLIGFKSTTTSGIAAYLGGVSEILDAVYGYQDGAFFMPTELEPGLGYWIAVTEPGTIYP